MTGPRRNPPARWALPEVIDPADRLCFRVEVPNDRNHIAAFMGALFELTKGYSWADDPAHKAKDVAKVWKPIFDRLIVEDCGAPITPCPPVALCPPVGAEMDEGMRFRISPDDPCIIQIECAADQWQNWYDPSNCLVGHEAQHTGGGILAAGECQEYDVLLQGSGQWLLPVPVSSGYTITVSALTGAWSDNGVAWTCPTGYQYFLGECTGTANGTQSGDPLNTAPHMMLIAHYQDVFTAVTHDVAFTIPGGTPDTNLTFQANDATLSDNAGSIAFHVKVCAAAAAGGITPTWSLRYNAMLARFTDESHFSFLLHGTPPCTQPPPCWQAGSGYGGLGVFQVDIGFMVDWHGVAQVTRMWLVGRWDGAGPCGAGSTLAIPGICSTHSPTLPNQSPVQYLVNDPRIPPCGNSAGTDSTAFSIATCFASGYEVFISEIGMEGVGVPPTLH